MGHASATNATPSAIGCRWRSSSGDGGQPEPIKPMVTVVNYEGGGEVTRRKGWHLGDGKTTLCGITRPKWRSQSGGPERDPVWSASRSRPGRSRRRRGGSTAASGVDRD